ncbi:hypothetical protein H6G54_26450 [Anabaena cylindrica FACHB-243]|uniref:Uncharacterized protein n=1 Tax=Anabaena cylindrica (strain ATCC 27899 / PCC 7122) TaxID=272123 RepID=K9ZFW6_ANACC|nr:MULTISPECIES: hypothetical protein [Anabaena]AFZ57482.1 hypothetical protein Anacy_1998 [Anabaena cylindrica PCC 7122]MBD2421166.1 hypothetical protein [Anabaena cylindrica FACHB-243]MBY5281127.1 hypothetical protein [Anabaena sp. CCAP 1446/1C]MBY5308537.1 hypothetical protein [Anabaena sp. CCAP 1446/1C]MCM2405921.1 hypothetical protein [Anabaena sp. CCAP 1446/1C]
MADETVTLQIPEIIYQRLVNTAHATQRPLEEVMLHALQVGSPPAWDDVPEEFQVELAALDKLDDNTLCQIFHSQKTARDMEEYNILLLEKNSSGTLTEIERLNLISLRHEADLFMLRKAQAAVLLRWRGYSLPNH